MTNFALSGIVIPTEYRTAVRACIRRAPGFDGWCERTGIKSRDMTRAQLDECAHDLGVSDQVLAILNSPLVGGVVPTNAPWQPGTAIINGDIVDVPMQEDDRIQAAADAAGMPGHSATWPENTAGFSAAPVLDPLAPFLSDKMLSEVKRALAPIVDAANKPAVEIVRTIETQALAPLAPGAAPYAQPVGKATMGQIFGFKGTMSKYEITLWNAGDHPKVDPWYVVDRDLMSRAMTTIEHGRPLWLAGPAGSGKTSLPMFVAAKTMRPFVRISFTRQTEIIDLVGSELFRDGTMVWADKVLTASIRRPGTIILLDEITIAPAGVIALFQTLLDHRFLTLPTGEIVQCAPGVTFIAADNTNGSGDATGRYAATGEMNAALMDRFERLIWVDYQSVDQETQALRNHTGAPEEACRMVATFVAGVRRAPGFEGMPLSLRRMTAFLRACMDGFSPDTARDDTMTSRLNDAEQAAFYGKWKTDFETARFVGALKGTPIVPVSHDPHQVAARASFDTID